MHMNRQKESVLHTHSMMSASYSQETGMSLLPANLSPATQKFSLCSGEVFVTTIFENHTDPTSILIYPTSTKMNKWAFWICHKESHSFIKQ